MTDSAGVRDWMRNELATMGEGTAEPMVDTIAPGGKLPFTVEPWRALVTAQRAGGYQAIHHSAAYAAAYHPAYRVVAGDLVP